MTNELIFANYFAAENSYWQDQLEQARAYQQSCMALAVQLQDQELIYLARSLGECWMHASGRLDVRSLPVPSTRSGRGRPSSIALDCRTRSLIAAGAA